MTRERRWRFFTMKKRMKWHIAILILLLLCLIPIVSALAQTGTVTASSLNMRKTASLNSGVVAVLRSGKQVTILGTSGSWYKIKYSGKIGYVAKKYIRASSSGSSSGKNSKSSKKATTSSDGTCGPGDYGDAVRKVQRRLKTLGYLSSVDGDYGSGTKNAVKAFQKRNGLSVTGKVNAKTLAKLNSKSAKKATAGSSSSSDGGYKTERLDWFHGGSKKIPKGAVFKIKDVKTGKVFTVKRWSGANHIDAEPLTRSDTAVMKKLYGHWSWKRRAVLVKYNGHVYAASINGMPHGTQTISNNGFDGHFCVHFYGSKTHCSQKVDKMHQKCVAQAMHATW